jgi:hypothetical protein
LQTKKMKWEEEEEEEGWLFMPEKVTREGDEAWGVLPGRDHGKKSPGSPF